MTESEYKDSLIIIADDDPGILSAFDTMLRMSGFDYIIKCTCGREVIKNIRKFSVDAVIADYHMPDVDGEGILEFMAAEYSEIPVIIVTGEAEVDVVVRCMKKGAVDYLQKPVDEERLVAVIGNALQLRKLRVENEMLKKHLAEENLGIPSGFEDIITRNRVMQSIFQYLQSIGPTGVPVLITGETGVGKEVFARAIHKVSGRTGRFVAVNVAGLDDHMFSDTLFGHQKGAFTGADRVRLGLAAQASGGTLFLDEIGDLSFTSQIKLLRLLQEKEYVPLGADAPVPLEARIIAATNVGLVEAVSSGSFRKDLYFRLKPHHVRIPPLRERSDDIPLLVNHFMEKAARDLNKKIPVFPPELIPLLSLYTFPGNIRELEGMIYDAVGRHTSRMLSLSTFRQHMREGGENLLADTCEQSFTDTLVFPEILPKLKEIPDLLVAEALKRSGGNQSLAAELLGISHQALSKRLKSSSCKSE